MNFTQNTKFVYLYLLILSFILYGNTIPNGYSLDDGYVVTENASVQKGLAGIPEILTQQYGVLNKIKLDYRPIVLTSFAIEYQLFGENPHVSHFINVLLYSLCLLVLYIFLTRTLQLQQVNKYLPLIIVLLYAVHPLHTEVVASLKNRDEMFSLIFGFLFLIYSFKNISSPEKVSYKIFALVFFMLSVLSKLTGLVFWGFYLLLLVYFNQLKNRYNIIFIILSVLFVVFIIKFNYSNTTREIFVFENSLAAPHSFSTFISTVFTVLIYHIKMLFIPNPLRFYYGFNLFPANSLLITLLSILLHLFLLVFGVVLLLRKKLTGVFILAYLGCLVLYGNYPFLYAGMYSERAQFVSSFWFIGAFVISLYTLSKGSAIVKKLKLIPFFISICSITFGFLTVKRNIYWKDNLTLMRKDIPFLKNSVMANYILAKNLLSAANKSEDSTAALRFYKESAFYFNKTIRLFPTYPVFDYEVAKLYYFRLHDENKAVLHLKNALIIDSLYKDANLNMGQYYFEKNKMDSAKYYLERIYRQNKQDSIVYYYLTQIANKENDLDNVYKLNTEYLAKYPELEIPYMNLGVYFSKRLRDDSAVIYFEKAIELGNRNPQLLIQLSNYYSNKHDIPKANKYYNLYQSVN